MRKFNWAYIGNGNIANSTAKNILSGDHSIVSVYGRNGAKAREFAEKVGAVAYDSPQEAIGRDDVDGVYIATPHTSHLEYAVEAMRLKKPVLCEKPVAVSAADAQTMIDEAQKNGVYFAEAMWTWFSPVALTVKDWVNSGKIGEVRSVEIYYQFMGIMKPKNSRVLLPETAGGALLDIGIYPITYCYNLFGYPDEIICNGHLKNGIDLSETVVLRYGDMKCTLHISFTELREDCTITGTQGTIKLPLFHMATRAALKSQNGNKVFRGKTDYLTEFTCVAREIREGRLESEYVPFRSTLDCLKIMDECRRQMGLKYPFE